jgi:hypothetical protein
MRTDKILIRGGLVLTMLAEEEPEVGDVFIAHESVDQRKPVLDGVGTPRPGVVGSRAPVDSGRVQAGSGCSNAFPWRASGESVPPGQNTASAPRGTTSRRTRPGCNPLAPPLSLPPV